MKDNGILFALTGVALVGALAGYSRRGREWIVGSLDEEDWDSDSDSDDYPDLANEAVIGINRGRYDLAIEGRYEGTFDEVDEALAAFRDWSDANRYYPNLYFVGDHGNVDLIDYQGNVIQSWV